MTISKNGLILFCVFLISIPINIFISLFIAVTAKILVNSKVNTFILAISIGLIGFFYVPTFDTDIIRWFDYYNYVSELSIDAFNLQLQDKPDKLTYILIYAFSQINIHAEFVGFVVLFASVISYISIFDLESKNLNQENIFFFITLFIIAIDYRVNLLGVRQGVSICFLCLSIYFFCKERVFLSFIFFVISSSNHFMVIPIGIILLIVYIINPNQKLLLVLAILSFIIPQSIKTNLTNFLSSIVSESDSIIVDNYTTGYWGGMHMQYYSFAGLIQSWIIRLPLLTTFIYLLSSESNLLIRKIVTAIIIFIGLVSFSDTLFIRYSYVITLLFPIMLILEFNSKVNMSSKLMILIYVCYMFVFVSMLYSSRIELLNTFESLIWII